MKRARAHAMKCSLPSFYEKNGTLTHEIKHSLLFGPVFQGTSHLTEFLGFGIVARKNHYCVLTNATKGVFECEGR